MKIALASIHPRMLSGQIEGLVALGQALEMLGHEVRLVSVFRGVDLTATNRWAAPSTDAAHPATKILQMARIMVDLVAASRGCDLVHFCLPTPSFAFLADAVQMATRMPMMVGFEAHLAHVPSAVQRFRAAPEFYGPRILINNGWVARATLHLGTRYVVSSDFQKQELIQVGYGTQAIDVIPNLVDRRKLRRIPRDQARKDLGLPDSPLVVFAGHYHDIKGHDILIEAFRRLRDRIPDARLVLAWSGIGRHDRVRAQIADAGLADVIIELGRVPIGALFSAADVVALPYRMTIGQAAFPGTVLEAMTVGVPLVTSALPLLSELVEHGKTGLLCRPGDAEDLSSLIAGLLLDPTRREQMIAAQHETMSQRFDTNRIANAYEIAYEKAIAGKTRVLQKT